MRKLLFILALFPACSTRHLEGHDRFTEVCVEGALLTLMELGNSDWDCTSPTAEGGQLRLRLQMPTTVQIPLTLAAAVMELAEWCPMESGECLQIVSGELSLTAFEEGIATSGSYHFVLSDDSKLEGLLAAQYCEGPSGC
jgi:hypothetical protein